MSPGDVISRLEELLIEEREAIARLDGKRVEEIARDKLALAKALEASTLDERRRVSGSLTRVVQHLRTNGVLLSHARGILRELLTGSSTHPHPSLPPRPAARLSIRG